MSERLHEAHEKLQEQERFSHLSVGVIESDDTFKVTADRDDKTDARAAISAVGLSAEVVHSNEVDETVTFAASE